MTNGTVRNPKMREATGRESAELAAFAAAIRFEDISRPVVDRAVDFFVDWTGSALSGRGQRAIVAESLAVGRACLQFISPFLFAFCS